MMYQTIPLALYVHWPFCVSKCPYCDFNSHVRAQIDHQAWEAALLADLSYEAGLLPGRRISSIFFGGGTPSLMRPSTVSAIVNAVDRSWGFTDDAEITLEANPSSVEASRFSDLAAAGVNRISLGLQALDDGALRFLGRAHSVSEGLAALEIGQRNFDRVSFDLIYARPEQSLDAWQTELERALSLGTEHLSLYQLTIERGTKFATEAAAGRLSVPDGDSAADLFDMTRQMTASAGISAYETSNHARCGSESRHNLTYWRYHDYVGIGPGAHGRRQAMATLRHKKPENWMNAVARNGHGLVSEESINPHQRATEALLMGLRLTEGCDLDHVAALANGIAPIDTAAATRLEDQGFLEQRGSKLRITDRGAVLLDAILPLLVLDERAER